MTSQTGIIAAAVQAFFAFRVLVLTRSNCFILLPLSLFILVGLGGSIAWVSAGVACRAIRHQQPSARASRLLILYVKVHFLVRS
jgi:hypothetical protein